MYNFHDVRRWALRHEFLLHVIHVGRYMLIIMVITRTEIVETGIAILINAAYQKVKVVIGISFFYVKLDDWLSLRFWLLIIWQEALSCYTHNKARKMIYINYCHKNNISDSKMSFLRQKTSGWPISRKTFCNDISRKKMLLFDKKVLTLHSCLRNNK